MIKKLLLITLLMCSGVAVAQSVDTLAVDALNKKPATVTFNHDGYASFHDWIIKNLTFPPRDFSAGQEVQAVVRFQVASSGKVQDAEVMKSSSPSFDKLLLSLMRRAPLWQVPEGRNESRPSKYSETLILKLHKNSDGALYAEDFAIYTNSQQQPRFEGGKGRALRNWICSHIGENNPDGSPIEERVSLSMVVEKDGSISGVELKNQCSEWLVKRLSAVLVEMPRFSPALQYNLPVRMRINVTLIFSPAARAVADARADSLAEVRAKEKNDPNRPFLTAEVMPKFQGGDLGAFRNWVMRNVKYPEDALKEGLEGRVMVSFVVERDGTLSTIRLVETPSHLLSDAVVEVVERSPKWTPGMQKGKPVRVGYILPVDFRTTKSTPSDNRSRSNHSNSPFGAPAAGSHRR